jgi:hypothetical protein
MFFVSVINVRDVFCLPLLQTGDRNNGYEEFLSDLQQKDGDSEDCRYGLYDYEYKVRHLLLFKNIPIMISLTVTVSSLLSMNCWLDLCCKYIK